MVSIKDYFAASPYSRSSLLREAAEQVNSFKTVLEVLSLVNSHKYEESYDAGISLLAISENVGSNFLKVGKNLINGYPTYNKDVKFEVDRKLEVLIGGLACSESIAVTQKLDWLALFYCNTDRRSVKAAIIDALVVMDDELPVEHYLTWFDKDNDEYISKYALEELTKR